MSDISVLYMTLRVGHFFYESLCIFLKKFLLSTGTAISKQGGLNSTFLIESICLALTGYTIILIIKTKSSTKWVLSITNFLCPDF